MIRTISSPDGVPDSAAVEMVIRKSDIHYPKTALFCLEISHYRYGGIVPPLTKIAAIREVSKLHGIPIHLDGARIFNAAMYLNIPVTDITRYVDSVMVSLSKGLGAPVGAMVCGTADFVRKASRSRKMLGGGMRQTGWLCACGIVALSEANIGKLRTDHDHARLLADRLSSIPGIFIDCGSVHTNFVIAEIRMKEKGRRIQAAQLLDLLKDRGVLATEEGEYSIRFVTSREVDRPRILRVIDAVQDITA